LALIHELGPVTHLKFATVIVGFEGKAERRVVAHLIIPREARRKIAQALLREGNRRDVTEAEEGISLH